MPRRRELEASPNEYLEAGEKWPGGHLEEGAPEEAEFIKGIAQRIERAKGEKSHRSVAAAAGIHTQTLINFLTGQTWGDAVTIYRLERSLKTHLWSRRHVPTTPITQRPDSRDDPAV